MIIDGRFVGSGKKNLYIKVLGMGAPVVVIETAWGGLSSEWQLIQEELAKRTTVLMYDRAGYGESPANSKPRSSEQIVEELHTMLINTGLPTPFIFIGHSAGGYYIQQLAALHPEIVGGMILVDSITGRMSELDGLDTPVYNENASTSVRMAGIKSLTELEDMEFNERILPMMDQLYTDFPDDLRHQLITYLSEKGFYETVIDEYEAFIEETNVRNQKVTCPDIPVKILCRDYEMMIRISRQIGIPEEEAKAVEELWLNHQKELIKLSPQTEFKIIKGASHSMHLSSADELLDEVHDMLDKLSGLSELLNSGGILEIG